MICKWSVEIGPDLLIEFVNVSIVCSSYLKPVFPKDIDHVPVYKALHQSFVTGSVQIKYLWKKDYP